MILEAIVRELGDHALVMWDRALDSSSIPTELPSGWRWKLEKGDACQNGWDSRYLWTMKLCRSDEWIGHVAYWLDWSQTWIVRQPGEAWAPCQDISFESLAKFQARIVWPSP